MTELERVGNEPWGDRYWHTAEPAEITAEQRARYLEIVKANPNIGNVVALRQAGVLGTKRDLRALVQADSELDLAAMEARGWSVEHAENVLYTVATDPTHPAWDRANSRFLRAYAAHRYNDRLQVEHAGTVEVNSDVADAIDRFTQAVSAAAVRHAARDGAAGDAAGALPGAAAAPRLAVARVAGET